MRDWTIAVIAVTSVAAGWGAAIAVIAVTTVARRGAVAIAVIRVIAVMGGGVAEADMSGGNVGVGM